MEEMERIVYAIEEHDVDELKACFARGMDPNSIYKGQVLFYELTSEYARGPRFRECVRAFVDAGLKFEEQGLLASLLNDAEALGRYIEKYPPDLNKKYSLRCAYTPMDKVHLLHVCAEFNHLECAQVLMKYGADINVRAGVDENGFGEHTPIFHTVNQNRNQSDDMLKYLLSLSADLYITVKGIIWGKGYPWETFIPSVNPISYAMMGLLPQMHRDEKIISETVSALIKKAYNIDYTSKNIPCAYLM